MQPKGSIQYVASFTSATAAYNFKPLAGLPDTSGDAANLKMVLVDSNDIAITSANLASDNIVAATTFGIAVRNFNYGFDGATWDRIRSFAGNADDVAAPTLGLLGSASFAFLFDGTTFDRARSASAANISALSGIGALVATRPGDWSINNVQGANAQATVARAAGAAGVRHVCTSIYASVIGQAAAVENLTQVVLRDGATGVGPIVWSGRLLVGPSTNFQVQMSGLNIVGSAATAMTLEFAAAGGASTFEAVSLTGYDVV